MTIEIKLQNILEDYKTGNYSCSQLKKKYNIPSDRISKFLKSNNLEVKASNTGSKRLTENEKQEIVKLYLTGNYNCEKLAKIYKVLRHSINSILKRRGVVIEKDRSKLNAKYKILNENFFEKIDTEEKAYFLGFLMADGYNNTDRNSIEMELQERDKYILEKLNTCLGSDRPLRFRKRRKEHHADQYLFSFTSKKICEDLAKLGCVKKKSLLIDFPTEKEVPHILLNHFIRGYFDGDGCINSSYVKKSRYYATNSNLVATKTFCEKLKTFLKKELNINSRVTQNHKGENIITSRFNISGNNQNDKFLDWMYKDSNIFLIRKYEKYICHKRRGLI